jgi:Xaa-Pro dipeptidase
VPPVADVGAKTPFAQAEYERRLDGVRSSMERRGIDVMVCTEPANLAYLTGYDAWSWYTPQAVVVMRDGGEPVWIGREQDAACARWCTNLSEDSIVGYPDECITDPERHGMDAIAQLIVARGHARSTIGTEDDGICLTPRGLRHLRDGLPDARLIDADRLVNWVRIVKSEAELEVMRQAGQIAMAGMRTAVDSIAPGVRECDAAAEIYRTLIAGTPEYGGEAPWRPTMPSGPRTTTPHLSWTDSPYEPGTPVNLELGGCRHQYHVGLSRTLHLGPPPDALRTLAEATLQSFGELLARIGPGLRCEEVHQIFRESVQGHGFDKASRCGYSIGIGFPTGVWIERTASLMIGDSTVLERNMTFHVVLGMWAREQGFMFSETVAITDRGNEPLAPFDRELLVVG